MSARSTRGLPSRPGERVRHIGISDSQLDAVLEVLVAVDPGVNLELRGGIANLADGRDEIPACHVQRGNTLVHFGVVEEVDERAGSVTFTIRDGRFSFFDHHPVRVERNGAPG